MLNFSFSFTSKTALKLLFILIGIEVLFCSIFLIDFLLDHPSWRIHELFDLDNEANIPTWFSTLQLALTGLFTLCIGFNQNYAKPPSKASIITLGIGFLYLSMDEAASIHEKITLIFHNNPWVPYFDGVHGIWIVVYGCTAILLSLIFHRDIFRFFKYFPKIAIIFLLAMLTYLAGAGGAETITYFYIDRNNPFAYIFEVITEEFLEMLGVSILLYSMALLALKKTPH